MASPTRVRNDFVEGHLQRLGRSFFNRASAYERMVAHLYGRFGIPRYDGEPVARDKLLHYFSSPAWKGLADRTSIGYFSPGTLPPPAVVLPSTDPAELQERLNDKLLLAEPKIGPIDLDCARRRKKCYTRSPKRGALVAYRIDSRRRLVWFLDQRCHQDAARRLVPLALGFSTGLVNHLLRGKLEVAIEARPADARPTRADAPATQPDGTPATVTIRNAGVVLAAGSRVQLFWDAPGGWRTPLASEVQEDAAANGDVVARLQARIPQDAERLVALVRGSDASGDETVAAGFFRLVTISGK
jgi:hypothetical protein